MYTIKSVRAGNSRRLWLRVSVLVALMSLASSAFAQQDSWDRKDRFQVLASFANQAVLDRETGLVWERSPSSGAFTWNQAQSRCNGLVIGNRMGWRVPALQELSSVLSIGSPNNLEPNHPFNVIPPWNIGEVIWTATTSATNPNNAWVMNLSTNMFPSPKNSLSRCWCVRFRQGVDPQ